MMMKFAQDGELYPAELFPRDNPNPQKVAEALARAGADKPKSERPLCPPRPIAGRPPGQLPEGTQRQE
jgi:hypothetical protein